MEKSENMVPYPAQVPADFSAPLTLGSLEIVLFGVAGSTVPSPGTMGEENKKHRAALSGIWFYPDPSLVCPR